MDGTLLGPDGTVSERTVSALRQATARGANVVLATGRPLRTSVPIAMELGVVDTVVAYNGAAMLWRDEFKLVRELGVGAAAEALARLRAFAPEASLGLETADGWFLEPASGVDAERPVGNVAHLYRGGPPLAVGPLERFFDQRIIKLNVVHEVLHPSRLAAELAGLELTGMWSLPFLLEVQDRQVDKSLALAWVCGELGVSPAEVAAFGDQNNDRGMLAWAGVGVAMGNAEQEASEVADVLGPPNSEDGLAQVVESWLRG